MKKRISVPAVLAACILLVAGCGNSVKIPEIIETTTVTVSGDGTVTSYLVEDFDKYYYNVSELSEMAVQDAESYNDLHQEEETPALAVEKVELLQDGKRVLVQHKYRNTDIYEDYNGNELFYGTVTDAVAEGYDLTALLTDVKDRSPLEQEELMKRPDHTYVLITDVKAAFYCPRKVTHVGDGVSYLEDGSVDTTQVEGMVVVLMK